MLNENGRPIGEGFLAFEGEDGAENILVGPGTFSLEIRADEASYDITVEDCTAGPADGEPENNPGDDPGKEPGKVAEVGEPEDVVNIPKGKMPDTGGFPVLLGAEALLIASGTLLVRVLRP